MTTKNPKVDAFLNKTKKWHDELAHLREIVLSSQLTEDVKWGQPCYTHDGKNVIIIHGFKDYCAILFIKGALLKDPEGLLIQQTENVQAGRQIRFTSLEEIAALEPILKAYVAEATEVEKAGLKVPFTKNTELVFPEEFISKLEEVPGLHDAFDGLTPGRRRAYNLFFSAPKQSKTRQSRIEKNVPQILSGKGLND